MFRTSIGYVSRMALIFPLKNCIPREIQINYLETSLGHRENLLTTIIFQELI
jgi:hypothetical protein